MSGGNTSGNGTLERKSITEYSPYVTFQQQLFGGALSLNGGLRMANSDKFGTHWLPQVGFAVRPADGWTLKGSVAKGYRNPSFRELYLYPPHNPDLDPESMINYEVTINRHFSRYLNVGVTGYFAEGSNIIQTVSGKNVNTGSFRNKGVELSAASFPTDALSLHASYSYMHTSLSGLTAAPKNQYYIGVDYEVLPQFTVDAELKGVGGLYVADGVEHQDYALLNLRLVYKPARFIDLFVILDNLTDASYMINNGYEMPGFTAMGGLKLKF